jgi:uncharacterized membrane protein YoaK (UPF0700 family)
MAVQNAGSRLILANHGPTTMMTGNTTQAVIDLVDLLRGVPEEHPEARKRLKLLVPAILAFLAGALLGAISYATFSFWCLIVPIVALLAVAWAIAARPAMSV